MTLDRGTLANVDQRLRAELNHSDAVQLVKVPVSDAVWSTWRRYCEVVGVTMGQGLAILLSNELGSLGDADLEELASRIPEREAEIEQRAKELAAYEKELDRRQRELTMRTLDLAERERDLESREKNVVVVEPSVGQQPMQNAKSEEPTEPA